MIDTIHKGIVASMIALFLFIGATIIEVAITIWAFKRFGGCPMIERERSERKKNCAC